MPHEAKDENALMSVDSALCVANFTKKGVRPNQLAVS